MDVGDILLNQLISTNLVNIGLLLLIHLDKVSVTKNVIFVRSLNWTDSIDVRNLFAQFNDQRHTVVWFKFNGVLHSYSSIRDKNLSLRLLVQYFYSIPQHSCPLRRN